MRVPLDAGSVTALFYRAVPAASACLIIAHGAGAGQRSAFIVGFARALASLGIDVVTFNFLYTEQGRRLPDRQAALEACYRSVIDAVRRDVRSARKHLFIGGKSMGGRIASHVAAADPQLSIAGLALLGYPLHPPGRASQLRDAHLPSIRCPVLFVQGTRDAFGTPAELKPAMAAMGTGAAIHTVPGGDHSFKLARKDVAAQTAVIDDAQRTLAEWVESVMSGAGGGTRSPLG